jgi:hypothetical protein
MEPANFIDVAQKAAATFALFVGACWVLMNYVRNRTHVPRLQIDVKAELIKRGSRRYLLANIQVKNPGQSLITLPEPTEPGAGPKGSALLVAPLASDEAMTTIVDSAWAEPNAFEILLHCGSIEPGLTVSEEKRLRLPNDTNDAFWVGLRVAAHGRSWSTNVIASPKLELTRTAQTAET